MAHLKRFVIFIAILRATTLLGQYSPQQLMPGSQRLALSPRRTDDAQEAWVRHYASKLVPSIEGANAIALDGHGNAYVAGYSMTAQSDQDYFTIKYDASGKIVWTARYDGPGHAFDMASAICLDTAGNVYVTGTSAGDNTGHDYATIKYNAAGREQWVGRYNAIANQSDKAMGIEVDAAGNVYVTGQSASEYATVKYNPQGEQLWVARYPGSIYGDEVMPKMALDAHGNVYVCGTSVGNWNFVIIKYDTFGAQKWVARYNGQANGQDKLSDLALDAAGNIYVTGTSDGQGTASDYATIKYNSAGVRKWVARFNGARNLSDKAFALALDTAGNVYVTGTTEDGPPLFTNTYSAMVKYNSMGIEQWRVTFDNPFSWEFLIATDSRGSIYVTGDGQGLSGEGTRDYITLKYDSAGVKRNVMRYNGPNDADDNPKAMAIDATGKVWVVGESEAQDTAGDFATVKYDNAGTRQWAKRYNGENLSDDHAAALGVEVSGNVFVTGSSSAFHAKSYTTVKYDAKGEEQWSLRDSLASAHPRALAIDNQGSVYVTGSSDGDKNFATVKYDPFGQRQWAVKYGRQHRDRATAIAVDAEGNTFVTGGSWYEGRGGAGTFDDYASIKYSATGVEQWVKFYAGRGIDIASDIEVDPQHNVYVTGGSAPDFATIKYSAAGSELWVARYKGPGEKVDVASALAVDYAGSVYVTGKSGGSGSDFDYATLKYDYAGERKWVARYNGPAYGIDTAVALAVDAHGNVFVTGTSRGQNTGLDLATIKYDSLGTELWVARYNGPSNLDDHAVALAIDTSGSIYVAGYSKDPITGDDFVTIKYDSDGAVQWIMRYNHPHNADDQAIALALDNESNVYVAGSSAFKQGSIFTTIKYIQTPVSVEEQPPVPHGFWLEQNYPNPFNPATSIRYSLAQTGQVSLRVFNLAGQEVATLVHDRKAAGQHEVQWVAADLPSGVYVYRLQAGESIASRKFLVLK